MQLKTYSGYWGMFNDIFYWADTLEDLKLRPESLYLTPTQATKMWFGDYCVLLTHEEEPSLLYVYSTKRVQLDEEYELLQILLKSVVLGVAPKIVDMVSESLPDVLTKAISSVQELLGSEEPKTVELSTSTTKRKESDTTKLTQYMYDFIVFTHTEWKVFNRQNPKRKKTMEELIDTINTYMGTNKSRTSLGRVWNGHINRDDLPVGTAYFKYPHKTENLS